ncbi:MAG: family 20 glycosylhydrolase, partial [Armatimonadota bacterium]
ISTLPAEGYVLRATPQGVRIVARDSRGLVHGLCTLFQAIESHYAQTFELAAPTMDVVDWPSLPIRAVSISIPTGRWGYPNDAPVDPIFFRDFLFRTVVMQKMNMVVLIVEQAMQYESHPKVSGPAAWPKETIGLIFDNMRRYGVEPVPLCNSLGHANWCAIPYRRLAEDGDVHQFCTSNPETKRVLLDIYQEIVDMVEPKYFHIGMDEIRWKTHTLPKEERCRLCAGKDKRDIFAEWVEMLRDFFAKQGIEVMMWGDMVLPDHNGGAPYHLSDALVRVPRDIVICNWSTALAPTSSYWFKQRGFQVIKANSRGATRQEQDWIVGNMMGIWYKVPWLMEGTGSKLAAYTYPSILEAAEYSWNFWPDPFNPIVPLTNDFLRARPRAQWRIAAAPVPRAQPPEPVALPDAESIEGIPDGEVEFAGLRFVLRGSALAPKPGGEARVEINRPVAALYLLHAAELPDRQAMIEALKPSESWEGVHIGGYEIQYASGRTKSIPIRYPMEVRAPQPGWCRVPVAHRALGVYPDTCQAAGKHLYAVQWVNPRLDDEVKSVTLRVAEGPARPMLVGLAIQEPR